MFPRFPTRVGGDEGPLISRPGSSLSAAGDADREPAGEGEADGVGEEVEGVEGAGGEEELGELLHEDEGSDEEGSEEDGHLAKAHGPALEGEVEEEAEGAHEEDVAELVAGGNGIEESPIPPSLAGIRGLDHERDEDREGAEEELGFPGAGSGHRRDEIIHDDGRMQSPRFGHGQIAGQASCGVV